MQMDFGTGAWLQNSSALLESSNIKGCPQSQISLRSLYSLRITMSEQGRALRGGWSVLCSWIKAVRKILVRHSMFTMDQASDQKYEAVRTNSELPAAMKHQNSLEWHSETISAGFPCFSTRIREDSDALLESFHCAPRLCETRRWFIATLDCPKVSSTPASCACRVAMSSISRGRRPLAAADSPFGA
jgi:hypothetical protein